MGKTVAEKLGLKPGMAGWALGLPTGLFGLEGFTWGAPPHAPPDVIIAFVTSVTAVAPALDAALPHYRRGKALWFAYPKKTGAIRTDITRDRGWEAVEAAGLLPVSQVALDDTWSALRFRFRDEIKVLTRKSETEGP